jgi:hypothetical protein
MDFNKFFLSIAKKINHNIEHSSGKDNRINNPIYYLPKLSNKPFTKMKFNNTTTSETEIIVNSLKLKNSHGCDEISTKIIKASASFINSPLNVINLFYQESSLLD